MLAAVRAWALVVALITACTEPAPPKKTPTAEPDATTTSDATTATTAADVGEFCKSCHRFPEPEILPTVVWDKVIDRMFEISGIEPGTPDAPTIAEVKAYYQAHAPKDYPLPWLKAYLSRGDLKLAAKGLRPKGAPPVPGVSSTRFVRLRDRKRLDLLITDMRHGAVVLQRPYLPGAPARRIGQAKHPAHAEVIDFDGDGHLDVLVAELGTFGPSETDQGKVIWLRGGKGGRFTQRDLITGLGRVADVRAADLDGDGDVDLAVGVFGFMHTGEVVVYENTGDGKLVRHQLDPRSGTTQLAIADLDGDGRLDIVAAVSQQYEEVALYLNRGAMEFEAQVLFAGPHPDWGMTRLLTVDLDGDGDVDVITLNGDVMDTSIPKPFHGIRWIENRGAGRYTVRELSPLPGAHGIGAGDLDGDGDIDLVASSFVPAPTATVRKPMGYRAIIWLEQIAKGKFVVHSLEDVRADHPVLDVADYDADGDPDIVVGNFVIGPTETEGVTDWAVLFDNRRIAP